MLPPLQVPTWLPPDDGEAGWEEETPRSPGAGPFRGPGSLPASPSARKTKARAGRAYMRTNSLRDAKVLVVSDMHRSESAMDPSLFQYHQHFESPWQLVGKTSLSEVFRVRHRASGAVYAVKRSRRRFRSKLQRERAMREIRAVAALPPHPNIVNQQRAWQEGGHFYIQMDYCDGGSLAQRAQSACTHGRCMPDDQLWSTACQTAQGLAFLHSHSVMHLDIKPDNIYLSRPASAGRCAGEGSSAASSPMPTCRIGDFGLAVARDGDGSLDWEEGDGDYVAPELLAAGGQPSPAADIFSLGATLYECATGLRLPRSNGWTAVNVAQLQLEGRPPAFLSLLRAMLQPDPALRPSAQQVLEVVAREQPAVAATAAAAVEAAAEAARAEAAAARAVRQAAIAAQQRQRQRTPEIALVPSPFASRGGSSPQPGATPPGAAAAAEEQQFSFDVPQQQGSGLAFTPGQQLRSHIQRGGGGGSGDGMPPGSTVKATPAGRGRLHGHGRWAPALSPLISEGALTPGAVAALAGLTPEPRQGSNSGGDPPTPQLPGAPGSAGGSSGRASGGAASAAATPLDVWRPAPLQLPPQTAAAAIVSAGGSSGMLSSGHPGSGGTQDSRDGWHLSRRDILSPDSDFLAGSHSESEYSYSCGTGRTTSDMDFGDALSPMSAERAFLAAAGHTPSTGTPESLRRQSCTPGSNVAQRSQHHQLSPAVYHQHHHQQQQQRLPGVAAGAAPGDASRRFQASPPLAWDLHTSPEFLMQLPPGSPDSLSRSSSLDDVASQPSRAVSVRRFPTLDSYGSLLDGAASKPPQRLDSLAVLAGQRLTNTFAQPQPEQEAAAEAAAGAQPAGGEAGEGSAAAAQHQQAGRALRKRQHSSRRTLMAALSRENSAASSLDGLAPPVGKARHILDSGGASPADHEPPLPHPMHRSGSMLGREAAAAAALAEAATKALMAAAPGMAPSPSEGAPSPMSVASTPSHHLRRGDSFDVVPPAQRPAAPPPSPLPRLPPGSPLHARMTGLKLRSSLE